MLTSNLGTHSPPRTSQDGNVNAQVQPNEVAKTPLRIHPVLSPIRPSRFPVQSEVK